MANRDELKRKISELKRALAQAKSEFLNKHAQRKGFPVTKIYADKEIYFQKEINKLENELKKLEE